MIPPLTEEKKQEWKSLIEKQQQSGLSIKRWCKNHQIVPHQYYYWKNKLFPRTLSRLHFTELTDQKKSGLIIEYKNIRIHLDKSFEPLLLKRCLQTLREIC